MIAQDKPDSLHFVWTQKSTPAGSVDIYYQFLYYQFGPGWLSTLPPGGLAVTNYTASGANVAAFKNRAAAVFHYGTQPISRPSRHALDFGTGMGAFSYSDIPGGNCSFITTGGSENSYSWPKIAVEESSVPTPIFHVITTEGDAVGGQMLSLVYHRGVGNPPSFGSCGVVIDSVLTTSAVVCQDPVSNKVAIVYLQLRNKDASTASSVDNDVVYRQSTDRGITWGPMINVTNYQNSDNERAYNDLTAMFTTQSTLHIAWTAPYFDHATQAYTNQRCKMKHWDVANNLVTTVAWADNIQSCIPGDGMLNIAKPCLSECDNKLYVTYTRFLGDPGSGTQGCSAGGFANGELFVQVSEAGGFVWGPPVNISNARTNGCAPGSGESENWPSAVEYSSDSLRIFCVGDTDAGWYADNGNQGTQTLCRMMFRSVQWFAMTPFIELVIDPSDCSTTPLELEATNVLDTTFLITNRGNVNAYCSFYVQYQTGPPGWLQVIPPTATISPIFPEDFQLSVIAPAVEGDHTATIGVQNSGGATIFIPITLHCTAGYTHG
jgi:hypothetical protein